MPTTILPATVSLPRAATHRSLSSARVLSGPTELRLLRPLSAGPSRFPLTLAPIRMGGGPRTYPGGVSKWQWKRMQAKKAKQLLKARLARERSLYEMRKRAELRAAVAELERPWEPVDGRARAPALFSVAADDQLKAIADRFQRPGGFDMWTERDGPEIFRSPADGLPSARFFPKGVAHSVKPYGIAAAAGPEEEAGDRGELQFDDWIARGAGGMLRRRRSRRSSSNRGAGGGGSEVIDVEIRDPDGGSDRNDENLELGSKNSMDSREESGTDDRTNGRRSSPSSPRSRGRSNPIDPNGLSDQLDEYLNLSPKDLMDSHEERDANIARRGSSRNHGNGRRQGPKRLSGSNAMYGFPTAKEEKINMVSNNRHGSRNGRFSSEKVSLRPTTDLRITEGDKRSKMK